MSNNNLKSKIIFSANKVYVHPWPLNSQGWGKSTKENVNFDLNKNIKNTKVMINEKQIQIDNYEFEKIKKVGVTVPLFKKETRMVFEGHFANSDAHVHITTDSQNYLEIFNKLMVWKRKYFPEF